MERLLFTGETYCYNAYDEVVSYTDAEGNVTKVVYDAQGNVTSTVDALGNVTEYTYRKDGLLTGIKDASGAVTLYEYNNKGLVSKETDVLGAVTTYEYDSEKRPVKVTTPDGTVTEYTYNSDGSITKLTATKVSGECEKLQYLYNLDGSLSVSVSGSDILEYAYNSRGSVTSVTKNNTHQVKLSYDGNGNMTRLEELTDGITESVTNYTYDKRGSLTKVSTETEGLLASYISRADGMLEQVTDGAGNVTKYQYNQQKQVIGLTIAAADGSVLYSEANTYNKNGSLLTQSIGGTRYETESRSYSYDALDRLLSETNNGQTTTYTYDVMGNRLTKTSNDITTSYTYDICNKLLTETTGEEEITYSYDALGNLITKENSTGAITYVYDALNQLVEVVNFDGTWQTSTYDASGLRSMITENGITTEFMTLNGMVVSGYDKVGQRIEHYYYGNSQFAAEYAGAETSLYYNLKNSHGDVIGLTDTYSTLTEIYRYDAFGTLTSIRSLNEAGVLAEAETALSRFLYAGEQYDNVTGLYYLRARLYDTIPGRFTQEDTYLGDGRNLYVYVSNNPLKYVDPSGHCSKLIGYNPKYNPYCSFMPSEIVEFQKQKEEAESLAWLNALNAGFTTPDSYSGYLGQQWGNYIAPTVQKDPAGSAYAFKEGVYDAIVPFRSSDDYFYTDMYLTGQMFGVLISGGISAGISGFGAAKSIQIFNYLPSCSIAGGSYSVALAGTVDVTLVANGLSNAYFGYSFGSMAGNAISSVNLSTEGGTHALPNAEDLKMSQTVQNHMNDVIKKGPNAGQLSRPYIDSDGTTLLLKEIMESADPVPDTILQSGLRWDVSGTFRGSTGTWELVVDTSTNTVVHFNFVAQ